MNALRSFTRRFGARLAAQMLVVLSGLGEVGAVEIARLDFVLVPLRTVVLAPASAGLMSGAVCLPLGLCALVILARRRSRVGGSSLLIAGAAMWAFVSLIAGGLLLIAVLSQWASVFLNNQVSEVRTSPSTGCAVVLTETAALSHADESVYVVVQLGIGSPADDVTFDDPGPLRTGRVIVTWRNGGGSVFYGGEELSDITQRDFHC